MYIYFYSKKVKEVVGYNKKEKKMQPIKEELEDLKTNYRLRPYPPKEIEEGTHRCPACQGRGKVLRAIYWGGPRIGRADDYEVVNCSHCYGTGLLPNKIVFE